MAKRSKEPGPATSPSTTTNASSRAAATDAIEQRVLAFAEQLGRIAGTVLAKAEGWMDRETLHRQIAGVRDGAADLLERLARETRTTTGTPPAAAVERKGATPRSGGAVDAPGKKHRKPGPADPDATIADSQASKVRAARTMVKTNKRRGRG